MNSSRSRAAYPRTPWLVALAIAAAELCANSVAQSPSEQPQPPPAALQTAVWERYELASEAFIGDNVGNIWGFLKDRPGHISKWDGTKWQHFPLDIDTASTVTLMVDNLNRPHVWLINRGAAVCRLDPDGRPYFAEIKGLLANSVATGAREFRSSNLYELLPPIVVRERDIYFCYARGSRVWHFNGSEWNDFLAGNEIGNVFQGANGSVMGMVGCKLFSFDERQSVKVTNDLATTSQYLLGENGLQPFERVLYESSHGKLWPAYKTGPSISVFNNVQDFLICSNSPTSGMAVLLSSFLERIWLSAGGFWSHGGNLPILSRYYEGILLNVDFAQTPLGGDALSDYHVGVYEDRNGSLWVRSYGTAFRIPRQIPKVVISTPGKAVYEGRHLRIAFSGSGNVPTDEQWQYAWRLDGGEWSPLTRRHYADLRFEEVGAHVFQVTAVGELGSVDTTPPELKFTVASILPEVRITTLPQALTVGPDVTITFEPLRRDPASRLVFEWRLDERGWQITTNASVTLLSVPDGRHLFDVRGVEDGRYIQTTPARIAFNLKTDYTSVVPEQIKRMTLGNRQEREDAAARLLTMGIPCLPYLRAASVDASPGVQWWLLNLIWQIEQLHSQP